MFVLLLEGRPTSHNGIVDWKYHGMGEHGDMKQLVQDIEYAFECKSEDELKEYMERKINIMRKSDGFANVKFTQPVLVYILEDKYNLPGGDHPKHLQLLVKCW